MKIQNFIFNWNQFTPNALYLEKQLIKYAKTTVINSNIHEKRSRWINLNDGYFAEQWNTLTSNIDDDTDYIFHIQADASIDNFDTVYSKFHHMINKYDVGIYSPNVDYTDHKYDLNLLNKLEENIYEVPNTDCTCWFINNNLIKNKLIYNINTNKIGYGADWYYSAKSILEKKYVLRDYSLTINHPNHKNYNSDIANQSLSVWMNEQPDYIKTEILKLMDKHEIYRFK